METLLSSFGIEWKMLIAQLVNFGILVFVLSKLVYKPLMKVLDEREKALNKLSEDKSSAEELLREAKEKQDELLADARKQSEKIMKSTEASVAVFKKNALDEAKKDAEKLVRESERKMQEERDKFYASLRKELVDLVSSGVEQTVGKYVTKDSLEKLKSEALDAALSSHKQAKK